MTRQLLFFSLLLVLISSLAIGAEYQRKQVNVPKVSPTAMTIDGKMNEAAWSTAAKASMVTSTGFEMFSYYYGRPLPEPDYDALEARLLWARDTLYVFVHIDEIVNDSSDLYWNGQWKGDQLFVGLSNRLGVEMKGWYDGNVYAAPDGPYHFWILGDTVTLNVGQNTNIPTEYRKFPTDTARVFKASDVARYSVSVNKTTGVWDVEMAIYNPHVNAGSGIAFNVGGSAGSKKAFEASGDAYAYWTWQPCVVDSPFAQPPNVPIPSWGTDPGSYNLANSVAWAMLNFTPGTDDKFVRKSLNVPRVAASAMKVDGKMNEAAWTNAAKASMVTSTGFEMFSYYYGRPLPEPDFDALETRLLWALDTLYVFTHIDEIVNDSSDLYWNGQWKGDQLFVGLSNRLGTEMKGWYDGNVYAAPDGPYHYWILGDTITLNLGNPTNIPDEYMRFPTDTMRVFKATDYGRFAASINKTTGVWDVEMAIYNPNVNASAILGFNVGGSAGSKKAFEASGDAYAYWTWQPCVIDSPFAQPPNVPIPSWGTDPGSYNLANSVAWATLKFIATPVTGIAQDPGAFIPVQYTLNQNYPNPFNPSTTIQYAIPKAGRITLSIFNVLGQKIATLVDTEQGVGLHQATWNASGLSSGVYLYQLKADDRVVATKKLMLLK